MKKRLFAIALAAVMLLSAMPVLAFNDLDDSYPGVVEMVEYWAERGVIEGDGNGNFEPMRLATYAEFIKMLVLATGKTEIPGAPEPNFSDVSESDWFYPYVRIAYQNRIIFDNEDGTFEPNKPINYISADTLCSRAYRKPMIESIPILLQRSDALKMLSDFEQVQETMIRVDGKIESSIPEIGVYKTVNEALEAAPVVSDEEHRVTLAIAPGTYRERIVIDKPYITLTDDGEREVVLTYYYGASRNYKSYDGLTPDMDYPERDDFDSEEEYAAKVKEYESQKTLLDGKPYVKTDGNIASVGTQNSASVTITENAHDFKAEFITFENSYNLYRTEEEVGDLYEPKSETDINLSENLDEKNRNEAWYKSAAARQKDVTVTENKDAQTQAVALRCSADRSLFIGCEFKGRQDTLYIKDKARCYFINSYVEGTVDFIFGDANAVFNHCEIHSAAYPNGGYITAGSHSANQSRGYLFYCCKLTGDEQLSALDNETKVKLGRPWKPDALVTYYKCYMGDHIATGEDRFTDMSGNSRENARFMEMSSRDLNGNYSGDDVYASYEYAEDCRYKYLRARSYLSAPYDKERDTMGEPDDWRPAGGLLFEYFDDGEIVDDVPVWYDDANEYFIPER